MQKQSLPVACLMGPTASGKTELAIQLAERGPFDIISVDSAMVYRDMDIGSAKPSAEELARAPHALIDIRDPAETYNVGDFRKDALALIEKSHAQGRIPLFAGGTMLYYKILLEGVADMPVADMAIRAELEARAKEEGWPALHAELAKVDPTSAERLHPNHSQRICRALEVYQQTGKTLTQWHSEQVPNGLLATHRVKQIALMPDSREMLHKRIELRFQKMLDEGFIAEVEKLHQRSDLHLDLPSMRSVGYRQVWQYLDNEFSYEEMFQAGVAATRQLAKRQFTWLRGWEHAMPLPTSEFPDWSTLNKLSYNYFLAND